MRQIEQAIRLAVDDHKAVQPTLHVEYLALDDSDPETGEWSREKELANAQRAAGDPSVIAYIGPYNSAAAMVSIPVTNRAGLLQVSPSATWPGLTQGGYNPGEPDIYYPTGVRTFIGMMPDDSLQATVAATWASRLDLDDIVVLSDGSSYSSGLAKRFEQDASALVRSKFTIDASDLTGLPIELGTPRTVFYAPASVQNALALARALHGTRAQVLATDVALEPQFLDGAGEMAANWLIVSNSVPDPPLFNAVAGIGVRFKANFTKKYVT